MAGGTVPSVEVVSSEPSVGVITSSPLVFTGADACEQTTFAPLAEGTTTIALIQPPGFTAPLTRTSVIATVEPA